MPAGKLDVAAQEEDEAVTGIVERLRNASYANAPSRAMEAADEIERLRAERDKALAAVAELEVSATDEAYDEIERLRAEVEAWHNCARYDPLMSGPVFKWWDRSGLDRCRKEYVDPVRKAEHD